MADESGNTSKRSLKKRSNHDDLKQVLNGGKSALEALEVRYDISHYYES